MTNEIARTLTEIGEELKTEIRQYVKSLTHAPEEKELNETLLSIIKPIADKNTEINTKYLWWLLTRSCFREVTLELELKLPRCTNCNIHPAEPLHTCPFCLKIDNDTFLTCNCCEQCEQACNNRV